jgi:hypothetical protein
MTTQFTPGACGPLELAAHDVAPGTARRRSHRTRRTLMRLRQLLLTTGAIVAAGALALVPVAQAASPTGTAINNIEVNYNGAPITHNITLTMTSASVQLNVYGIPMNITCTAGSAGGVVNGGTSGVSPNDAFTLTSMSMTCPSIFPGTSVSFALTCNVGLKFVDSNVHAGINPSLDVIDTGTGAKISRVDGTMSPNNCVSVTISNGCRFTISGSSTLGFDEAFTAKGLPLKDYQPLHLGGSGLRISNVTSCAGAVTNLQALTLTAVFDVWSFDGLIDFQ